MNSNDIISFTVPGNPIALKRHRDFQRGKFRGRYDPSKGDKADFLAKVMEHKPDKPFEGAIKLIAYFYFRRPKSHYRAGKYNDKLKPNVPYFHTQRPDYDNLAKFVTDALNSIFWIDDKQIAHARIEKIWDELPRIYILIKNNLDK